VPEAELVVVADREPAHVARPVAVQLHGIEPLGWAGIVAPNSLCHDGARWNDTWPPSLPIVTAISSAVAGTHAIADARFIHW